MTHQVCAAADCDRPTETMLCGGSRDELVAALRSLAVTDVDGRREHGLAADLALTMTRRPSPVGAYEKIKLFGSGHAQPLPHDPRAAETWTVMASTVALWAGELARVNTHLRPAWRTVAGAAAWMSRYPTLLAAHPAAGDMHTSILSVVGRVWAAIDLPEDTICLGRCPGCDTVLYARAGRAQLRCTCGQDIDVAARQAQLRDVLADELATATAIGRGLTALGLPVKPATIRQWAARDRLATYEPHPRDPRRTPRYRVGDVLNRAIQHAQEPTRTQRRGHPSKVP